MIIRVPMTQAPDGSWRTPAQATSAKLLAFEMNGPFWECVMEVTDEPGSIFTTSVARTQARKVLADLGIDTDKRHDEITRALDIRFPWPRAER